MLKVVRDAEAARDTNGIERGCQQEGAASQGGNPRYLLRN